MSGRGTRAEGRVGAMARSLKPVPHDVCRAPVDRIGGDGLLVVEELGDLEDRAGALVGLDQALVAPRLAAIGRGDGGDAGVVIAADRVVGCQQTDGVCGAVRANGDPAIRGPVIGRSGERIEDGIGRAYAERQGSLAPGRSTIR